MIKGMQGRKKKKKTTIFHKKISGYLIFLSKFLSTHHFGPIWPIGFPRVNSRPAPLPFQFSQFLPRGARGGAPHSNHPPGGGKEGPPLSFHFIYKTRQKKKKKRKKKTQKENPPPPPFPHSPFLENDGCICIHHNRAVLSCLVRMMRSVRLVRCLASF